MRCQTDNKFLGVVLTNVFRPLHVLIQKPFAESTHDAVLLVHVADVVDDFRDMLIEAVLQVLEVLLRRHTGFWVRDTADVVGSQVDDADQQRLHVVRIWIPIVHRCSNALCEQFVANVIDD